MKTTVTESRVDGFRALTVASDALSLTLLPDIGGKTISLINKGTGREFLWRNPHRAFQQPAYGGDFSNYDYSGFDECFPTVGECFYPEYPWKGIVVPGHGEVWTRPWDFAIEDDAIHLSIYGVRFPYRLDKWISYAAPDQILLRYQLTNLSPFPFKYIWLAHPLLAVTPATRILLPEGVRVRVELTIGDRLGGFWSQHPWPVTRDSGGNEVDLSLLTSKKMGFGDKIYTDRLGPGQGWCALRHTDTGEYVAFCYSPEEVPYTGVWINQGGWPFTGETCFNVALEPCLGRPDRLDVGILYREVPSVAGRGTATWSTRLMVGKRDRIASISPEGAIK